MSVLWIILWYCSFSVLLYSNLLFSVKERWWVCRTFVCKNSLLLGYSYNNVVLSRDHHCGPCTPGCVWVQILCPWDPLWLLWLVVWWCPVDSSPPTAQSSLILWPISPHSRTGAEGGNIAQTLGGWCMIWY